MKICNWLGIGSLTVAVLVMAVPWASAYPDYSGNPSCSTCHPGFVGGFSGPLHINHLTVISDCLLCHNNPGDNPELGKCAGCHVQAGLVAHHTNAGAPPDGNGETCVGCHPGLTPNPESTIPPYYSLSSVLIKDPCAGGAPPGEDMTGDGQGLDNDGDLAYDGADGDCGTPIAPTTWGRIKVLYDNV